MRSVVHVLKVVAVYVFVHEQTFKRLVYPLLFPIRSFVVVYVYIFIEICVKSQITNAYSNVEESSGVFLLDFFTRFRALFVL